MSTDPSASYTLEQLQAHPAGPAAQTSAQTGASTKTFNDVMRMKPPELVVNPPAESGHSGPSPWIAAITPPRAKPAPVETAEAARIKQLEAHVAQLQGVVTDLKAEQAARRW